MAVCSGPRPRLYVYNESIGIPPWSMSYNARLGHLPEIVRRSEHHTLQGECADFFLVHNYVSPTHSEPRSNQRVLALFERLAHEFTFFNRSGPRSHLLISPCDHGPGDCMFERDAQTPPHVAASAAVQWADLDPKSSRRRVGFLTLSGSPHPNPTNFLRGLDIRLPASDLHQCGPFCGSPHIDALQIRHAKRILRRYSPWSLNVDSSDRSAPAAIASNRAKLPPLPRSLRSRRTHRLFFAGRATKGGDRGDLFRWHRHERGFLLHDTSGRFPPVPSNSYNHSRLSAFAKAMASSDFCFSPLGQSDGDSDRYLPAVLYGCVPVFPQPNEVLPFDDVLPWSRFSVQLKNGAADLRRLPAILAAIDDARLRELRHGMAHVWQRLLWAKRNRRKSRLAPRLRSEAVDAISSSYLGEDGLSDAFSTFIRTLELRLAKLPAH